VATVYVLACAHEDMNVQAGTCAQEQWIPQPSVIPALSIADAQQIGMQVAFLLAVAFVFRTIRKFIERQN